MIFNKFTQLLIKVATITTIQFYSISITPVRPLVPTGSVSAPTQTLATTAYSVSGTCHISGIIQYAAFASGFFLLASCWTLPFRGFGAAVIDAALIKGRELALGTENPKTHHVDINLSSFRNLQCVCLSVSQIHAHTAPKT